MSRPDARDSRPRYGSIARIPGVGVVVVVVAFGLFVLPACNLLDWHHPSERSWRGTYAWGFEESAFRSCGSTTRWWVTSSDADVSAQLVNTHRQLTNETMYAEVFVRFRGTLSERGTYGHVGAYERELDVTEIIEMRVLADGECDP